MKLETLKNMKLTMEILPEREEIIPDEIITKRQLKQSVINDLKEFLRAKNKGYKIDVIEWSYLKTKFDITEDDLKNSD